MCATKRFENGFGEAPSRKRGRGAALRTILVVDPTTQAFVAALIGALVAGGGVLAWHVSERQQSLVPATDQPAVPEGIASVRSRPSSPSTA